VRPARALSVALPQLQPVWGLRLPPADLANNDLNLSNVLTDRALITGVVDWDEFGLGSRALDLIALALDCERGDHAAADRLLAQAARVAGGDGLHCLVSYRAIAGLAYLTHEWQAYGNSLVSRFGDACAVAADAVDDLVGGPGPGGKAGRLGSRA
jgi:aminoglycoside phosphotransferase (APT) family kinase protein